jgi:hypothetical protein
MFDQCTKFDISQLVQINPKKTRTAIDATKGLDADEILRTSFTKHEQQHIIRGRKAKQLMTTLPGPGEVQTILMSGSFDGWDFVEATLQLAAPAIITHLFVATLGFGETNAGQLLQQLDSGRIQHVWFVASCYMRDSHGSKYKNLSEMLTTRGHQIRATRNHAKLIAMQLSDGRTISVDGSLNLCSCRNTEQAHVWGSPELFAFYSAYIKDQHRGNT